MGHAPRWSGCWRSGGGPCPPDVSRLVAPSGPDVDRVIRAALAEDLGDAGDITSRAVIPPAARMSAALVAREAGVVAGLPVAARVFALVNPEVACEPLCRDGSVVTASRILARIHGPATDVLAAERTALNFVGHLSGIATRTARFVSAVAGTRARILDTRKTTPGLRTLEKYAVRAGGGTNHRIGLYDAVLIKDNHIAVAGSVARAVRAARPGTCTPIEVEVDTLEQAREAAAAGADIILLDNMDPATMREAVRLIDGKALTEASGGIDLERVRQVAETGVDRISAGALTYGVPRLNVALDFESAGLELENAAP